MEYGFGTVKVKTEIQEDREEVATLQEVRERYSFLEEKMKEHLYALYLDNDNEVIGDKLVSLGKGVETSLDVKDIVRTAILTDAEAVILIHNHPSTNSEPTESDLSATQEVQTCLKRFGVQLLDHVIISRNGYTSFKSRNLLEKEEEV